MAAQVNGPDSQQVSLWDLIENLNQGSCLFNNVEGKAAVLYRNP